jgi:hypothetical protein
MFKKYIKTATVMAKLFEKGDEDGFIHRDGVVGAIEDCRYKLQPDLVPYIKTLENNHLKGEFGKHYICIGIEGEKWLVEKSIFEDTYKEIDDKVKNKNFYIYYNEGTSHNNRDDVAITEAYSLDEAIAFFKTYYRKVNKNNVKIIDCNTDGHKKGYVRDIMIVSMY